MRIPDDEEIFALHVRHAPTPEALAVVYTHSEIVRRIALRLLDGPGPVLDGTGAEGIDAGLVRAGSLLHDVGVYRLYDAAGRLGHTGYIRHGVLGHELLAEAGYPEELCRFASRHTGVGITRDDVLRQELPLPPATTSRRRRRRRSSCTRTSSTPSRRRPPSSPRQTYAAEVARFGPDKPAAFARLRERFGEPGPGGAQCRLRTRRAVKREAANRSGSCDAVPDGYRQLRAAVSFH